MEDIFRFKSHTLLLNLMEIYSDNFSALNIRAGCSLNFHSAVLHVFMDMLLMYMKFMQLVTN